MKATGTYIVTATAGESFRAFVPNPLPPDPPIVLTDEDHDLMEKANRALGRLDGVATLLPDVSLFLYFYVRKEAVLSSQIEGTQSAAGRRAGGQQLRSRHESRPQAAP